MRTKLPPCPKCNELDLYVRQMGDQFELRCAECGWSTGRVTLATGQDIKDVIAQKVEAAKEMP